MSLHFSQLSQQEQANAASPKHAFPVTAVGRAADSAEVIVSARIPATKKEVHRIPANSGLLRSLSVWWPMITGGLPATSLATLKKGLPAVGVETWQEVLGWVLAQYPQWDDDKKILFQAEVGDLSPDVEVGRFINNLSHEAFVKLLTGEGRDKDKEKVKTKLLNVIVWWSVYAWVEKAKGKEPIYTLRLHEDDSILDTPLGQDEWVKLIKAALPQMRSGPSFEMFIPLADATVDPDPTQSWKALLQPQASNVQGPCVMQAETIFEEVLFLPDLIIPQAAASLRQLLVVHQVANGYLRALDAIRLSVQLQAALRQIWGKATAVQRLSLMGPLSEWINACTQLAPSQVTMQERQQVLQSIQAALVNLLPKTDWVSLSYSILFSAPSTWDLQPLHTVVDMPTFRAAVLACVQATTTKTQLKAFQRLILETIQAATPMQEAHKSGDEHQLHWFLKSGEKQERKGSEGEQIRGSNAGVGSVLRSDNDVEAKGNWTLTAIGDVGPGATVRLQGLSSKYTAQQYNQVLREALDSQELILQSNIDKGFAHVIIPQSKFDAMFRGTDTVEINHPSTGVTLQA